MTEPNYTLGRKSRAALAAAPPELVAVAEAAIARTLQDFRIDGSDAGEVRIEPYGTIAGWTSRFQVALAVREAAIEQGVAVTWGAVPDRLLNDLPGDVRGLEAAVQEYDNRQKARGGDRALRPELFLAG